MPRDAGADPRDAAAAALGRIAAADAPLLAALWTARHGAPPPTAMPERLLRLALAWELQADADRTSTKRLARRLDRLVASGGDPHRVRRQAPPRLVLKPGTALVRDWGGRTHRVEALTEGRFAWAGRDWRSLSAIAREITGTRRNGPAFFGLREAGRDG
ncbi:MAG: DUF2924 domain-containing protein [Pseudomonadota bacterium]